MKTNLLLLIRVLLLVLVYFVTFAVVSAIVIPRVPQIAAQDVEANIPLSLLIVSLLNAVVVAYVILRSRIVGWPLVLLVFIELFGVSTFLSQIETLVFVTRLPPGMLPRIFLSGLFVALIFSTLAVVICGKLKASGKVERTSRLNLSVRQWLVRFILLGCCYVIIYFTFGYFLAWRNPAVRAYYQGGELTSFMSQLSSVVRDTPWLPLFQFARGVLWVILGVLLIRVIKGQWWEAGLAVALCFAVFMSALLLIPNPLMPREVRLAHLIETASSNFLFGWLVVVVLVRWRGVT